MKCYYIEIYLCSYQDNNDRYEKIKRIIENVTEEKIKNIGKNNEIRQLQNIGIHDYTYFSYKHVRLNHKSDVLWVIKWQI